MLVPLLVPLLGVPLLGVPLLLLLVLVPLLLLLLLPLLPPLLLLLLLPLLLKTTRFAFLDHVGLLCFEPSLGFSLLYPTMYHNRLYFPHVCIWDNDFLHAQIVEPPHS